MSRYTPSEYDWDDKDFLKWRKKLTLVIPELDDFFDEIRRDNHDGTCWDLINDLATILALKQDGN